MRRRHMMPALAGGLIMAAGVACAEDAAAARRCVAAALSCGFSAITCGAAERVVESSTRTFGVRLWELRRRASYASVVTAADLIAHDAEWLRQAKVGTEGFSQ